MSQSHNSGSSRGSRRGNKWDEGAGTRVGKVLQNPPEVAQATTTITDSLMQEQQVNSLGEALRNVPGLNFSAAEARLRLRACGAAPAPRVARTDGSARR